VNLLVTGGAGFIGSHIAEYYAQQGHKVVLLDNLSRARLLQKATRHARYNWHYLSCYRNIELVEGDIRDLTRVRSSAEGMDVIFHAAAQTAVTVSVSDPKLDFVNNAVGTFNVLEAARCSVKQPAVIFCSTNKVYGDRVNHVGIVKESNRYQFEKPYTKGIPETLGVDLCEHSPYGCSKLVGDLYMQDYAKVYGLKIGVFRMSCIYGPRQFGVEDQGWVAWLAIATTLGRPITIYGDGLQVRDVLYIDDLVRLFDAFIQSEIAYGVYNVGGGPQNTLSILELLDILEHLTERRSPVVFADWRPSDQKVYVSDIRKVKQELGWQPQISPQQGVKRLLKWIKEEKRILEEALA